MGVGGDGRPRRRGAAATCLEVLQLQDEHLVDVLAHLLHHVRPHHVLREPHVVPVWPKSVGLGQLISGGNLVLLRTLSLRIFWRKQDGSCHCRGVRPFSSSTGVLLLEVGALVAVQPHVLVDLDGGLHRRAELRLACSLTWGVRTPLSILTVLSREKKSPTSRLVESCNSCEIRA